MISMKKEIPRVLGAGLMECLLFFPVLFIPMIYLVPHSLIMVWTCITVLGYVLGFAGSRLFRLDTFLKVYLWVILLTVSISYFLFGASLALLIAVPSLFITCYRGARLEQMGLSFTYSLQYFVTALGIYGVSSFVLSFIDSFKPYNQVLTIAGAIAVITTVFVVNRIYVEEQTLSGAEKPLVDQRVRRQNIGMITVLLLLITVLALLPMLKQWIVGFGKSALSWIMGLFGTPSEEPTRLMEQAPATPPELPFPLEQAESSALAVFLEKLVSYVVFIVIAALVVYLLYSFIKILHKVIHNISKWMNRLMSRQALDEANLGYEDEEIEIEHEKAVGRLKRLRFKGRRKQGFIGDAESSDNAAQIRRVYRRILIRNIREGYKWKSSQTPRETKADITEWNETNEPLSDEFIRLYEQARYGRIPIRDGELNNKLKELRHK
ncbi:DUF4129 domain-containing protein [Paenibacillus dakarensis]|uniref:DUF4129 domain-containing protein n=1 Tax=Paenibacillus dakarensis TaxID=1527293 RepID=UPI0006D54BC3|nr:DUF4129 domain-containing protein [Paenibacillus dakarensis]